MMRPHFIFGRSGSAGALLDRSKREKTNSAAAASRPVDVGSVLRALPDAALLLDIQGRVLDANEVAEKTVARSKAELVGASAESLLNDRLGRQQEAPQSWLARALAGEWVESGRQVFRTCGGRAFPVTLDIRPVRDTWGKIAGVLLTLKDVSEVADLQGELEKGVRHVAVGEMTAGLVHDFSNVLTTISEAVMVLEGDHSPSEHEHTVLDIIHNSVRRGAESVNNLRRYLTGNRAPPGRVDVRQLLEEVLELIHPVLNTHKGLTVIRDTQSCAPVDANPDELRRAFTNLVMNALEAMPENGTLTVTCRQSDGRVIASIGDTGAGIPAELQKRIFSAYFTTKPKGTGLGLAGARRAIEAQRGDIRFESVPGRGTTFYVSLPVLSEAQASAGLRLAERKVS